MEINYFNILLDVDEITGQEKRMLEKYLDNIRSLLEKVPNSQVEGTTEFKIIAELEKINQEFDVNYIGKYL